MSFAPHSRTPVPPKQKSSLDHALAHTLTSLPHHITPMQDVYMTVVGSSSGHLLFVNDGSGLFSDESAARGAEGVLTAPYPGYSNPTADSGLAGVAAGDVNRDG